MTSGSNNDNLFVQRQRAFLGEESSSSMDAFIEADENEEGGTNNPNVIPTDKDQVGPSHTVSNERAHRQELNRMLLKGARKVAL